MAAKKNTKPILAPERELPAPHDMLIASEEKDGMPSGRKTESKYASEALTTTKKRSFPMWIFPLLALLIVIFAGGMYFLNSQKPVTKMVPPTEPKATPTVSPNPTASWKTYHNDEMSFEVKYPNGWYVVNYYDLVQPKSLRKNSNRRLWLLFGKGEKPNEIQALTHGWPELNISVDNKPHLTTELKKTGIDQGDKIEGEILNKSQNSIITINGIQVNKRVGLTAGLMDANQSTLIRFNRNDQGWSIEYPNIDYQGHHNEIYDQIISTFTFLSTPISPTCTPRPKCLDATPRCMIPETEDMCPANSPSPSVSQNMKGCTLETKLCPDGSTVGRTGPSCEFAQCPK